MTLQEVIKSGKPFRRPNFQSGWQWIVENGTLLCGLPGEEEPYRLFDDCGPNESDEEFICATDWEVVEPSKPVTFTEIRDYALRTLRDFRVLEDIPTIHDDTVDLETLAAAIAANLMRN